jgi:hypothetical protein
MQETVSRRRFAQLVGASTGALLVGAEDGAAHAPLLDLDTPLGNLHAYMKLHTSVTKARIWYWYTGIMEGAAGDGPVIPVVAIDTLIRRDVTPLAPGRFAIEMFEANYFHAVGDHAPLHKMKNPLNGREVEPFHYREGPHHVEYSVAGIYDPRTPPAKGAPGFAPRWQRAGDQIWTTNTFYLDRPYPLPLDRWPLEGNVRERVGSFANLFGSYAELADPHLDSAKCTFAYEAFMEWWPWMLMGAAPGHMLWHAGGRKLESSDDIPAASRRGFEAMHPRIFEERPWEELSMLAIDYPRQRSPVLR